MPIDEIFDDEFMNDMLLNPNAYGIEDDLKPDEFEEVDEDIAEEDDNDDGN